MPDTFPLGRFLWYELMTTAPDAAIPFYKKIVGWGLLPWDQDPSYRMFTAGGTPIGAVMNLPAEAKQMGAPPHWMFYVAVPDTDATVRQAQAMGARAYVEAMDIPSVGRLAVLADPQGATFAILQPAGDPGSHDGPRTPGEFSWHELATTDPVAAWSFYRTLFRWDDADAMESPMGTYQMFGRAGIPLGGIYRKPPEMPAPPHWLCYAMVASADRAATEVTRLGGRVLNGPMEVPGGDRIAQCMDPQGAVFAVHSVAPAMKAAPAPRPKPKARPRPKPKPKPKKKAVKKPVKKAAQRRPTAARPVKKAARKGRPVKKRATTRKKRR